MKYKVSIGFIILLFLVNACGQERTQKAKIIEEIFSNELGLTLNERASKVYYIINSMSCETCIEMNLDYFSKNYDAHDIKLILVNKTGFFRFENFQKVLDTKDTIHTINEEQISLYNIRTLDPLLIVFDENGELVVSKNIEDDEVFHLNQIIDEII